MVLLDQVIEILARPDQRVRGQNFFGLQFSDRRMSRRIAVNGDLLRHTVLRDRLSEESLGCGIELAHQVRKGQFDTTKFNHSGGGASQMWEAVLAA